MDDISKGLLTWGVVLGIIFIPPIIFAIYSALYERTRYSINRKAKIKIEKEIQNKFDEEVSQLNRKINALKIVKDELDKSISQEYPYLAESISNYLYLAEMNVATYMERKYRPARSTAFEIKNNIAKEKKEITRKYIATKNQLNFYENILPWLVKFKEMPPHEAVSLIYSESSTCTFNKEVYNQKWIELEKLLGEEFAYQGKIDKLQDEIFSFEKQKEKLVSDVNNLNQIKSKLNKSISQEYPFLSDSISEYLSFVDMQVAEHIAMRANKTAKEIKETIATEKKEYKRQSIAYKNQLNFYEFLFPWLIDFKELPPEEAIAYTKDFEKGYSQSDDRHWLSPEEFSQLDSAEKSQLILDRWKKRKKSKWEIGIEYEQYIGYILEAQGYRVEYQGAKLGLEDMGIDLIAELNGDTWIIQCKRWNENKTIHEKHIFQLYGSKVLYEIQHPGKRSYAMFVIAEDNLSDLAKQCANKLNVFVRVSPHKDHPLIKCNINNGEKIYHLPMDQQYHRIIIDKSKGEFYAWTAKEAECKGFRRAIKHNFRNS